MNQERLHRVLTAMEEQHIPQLLVSDPHAIFYLTGKWIHPGERLLALYLTTGGKKILFVNELFPITEDLGAELVWLNDNQDGIAIVSQYLDPAAILGIDKNWPARFVLGLMERNAVRGLVNGSPIIDQARMVKDKEEQALMRESSRLNDIAVQRMIALVGKGYTEKKMGKILGDIWDELGAEGHSFDPIVAYGANAADPHHANDDSLVKPGDSVILDIGCKYKSYCSDTTRTVFYQSVSDHARDVYETVRTANLKAIDLVKPGVRFCDIDAAARDYITSKGYGKYFTHRLGHCCGLEDHEGEDVSSVNTNPVQPGYVFSIEPGIYLPGDVGVRIEDLVIVTEDGCEVLNHTSKDLQIVE